MKRIIAQIAVVGMMTFTAQVRAGELSAMESSSIQGRIFISVNDFQKIIRGSERILSSETGADVEVQDVRNGNTSIAALKAMSSEDKAMLYKKVLPIAKHEAQALSSVLVSLNSKLAAIKTERKKLQLARLNQSANAGKVQEELFANLLEESNLEAKIAESKRQIQESHVLVLEYKKNGNETALVNVQHGTKSLWNQSEMSEAVIAQN